MKKSSSKQILVKEGELPFKGIFVNFEKEKMTWENTEVKLVKS